MTLNDVRVFDKYGKLKKTISGEELSAKMWRQVQTNLGVNRKTKLHEQTCFICGEKFKAVNRSKKYRRFCANPCLPKHTRKAPAIIAREVACKLCGVIFKPKKNGKFVFCRNPCDSALFKCEQRKQKKEAMMAEETDRVWALVEEQQRLESELALYERKAKEAKRDLDVMSKETFPDLLRELELSGDLTIKGVHISLKSNFSCSFPSATAINKARGEDRERLMQRKQDALRWLLENDHGDLVRSKVEYMFGLGEKEELDALKAKVEEVFPTLEATISDTVHPGTLKKFLKELGADGVYYPRETFSVSEYKRVEIN